MGLLMSRSGLRAVSDAATACLVLGRRRRRASPTPLADADIPSDGWLIPHGALSTWPASKQKRQFCARKDLIAEALTV